MYRGRLEEIEKAILGFLSDRQGLLKPYSENMVKEIAHAIATSLAYQEWAVIRDDPDLINYAYNSLLDIDVQFDCSLIVDPTEIAELQSAAYVNLRNAVNEFLENCLTEGGLTDSRLPSRYTLVNTRRNFPNYTEMTR